MDIRILLTRILHIEFIRFCIVGVIATCLHYGIYLLLIHLVHLDGELWTNVAYTIGYIFSFCCNLWLTAHFTFHASVNVKRGICFAASHAINYALQIGFLNLFLWIGVPCQLAPIPVFCLVIPINFILVRTIFKHIR